MFYPSDLKEETEVEDEGWGRETYIGNCYDMGRFTFVMHSATVNEYMIVFSSCCFHIYFLRCFICLFSLLLGLGVIVAKALGVGFPLISFFLSHSEIFSGGKTGRDIQLTG
jgi:hypothetical protein